jgi:chromosome partitioning protein
MKIITIGSLKGGVGKSDVARQLAGYFASDHKPGKVCLIDGDTNETNLDWFRRAERNDHPTPFRVHSGTEQGAGVPPGTQVLILDTQGNSPPEELVKAAATSSLFIIPTGTTPGELTATVKTLGLIPPAHKPRVKILLSRVNPRGFQAERTRKELTEAGYPMLKSMIASRGVYPWYESTGRLIGEVETFRSKAAMAEWVELYKEIKELIKCG